VDIPNWNYAVEQVKRVLVSDKDVKKKAQDYGLIYKNRRGLMVVDVVASRQRKYLEYVVPKLLPQYEAKAADLSLLSLAKKAPIWMPLRTGEAKVMQSVAKVLLDFGNRGRIKDENDICLAWAEDSSAHSDILDIKGIGPALLQYLRMRSGADSVKIDVRVMEELKNLRLPVDWFTSDGLLQICTELAREASCSLVELDQVLWHLQDSRNS
jgi:hypothetical protein